MKVLRLNRIKSNLSVVAAATGAINSSLIWWSCFVVLGEICSFVLLRLTVAAVFDRLVVVIERFAGLSFGPEPNKPEKLHQREKAMDPRSSSTLFFSYMFHIILRFLFWVGPNDAELLIVFILFDGCICSCFEALNASWRWIASSNSNRRCLYWFRSKSTRCISTRVKRFLSALGTSS